MPMLSALGQLAPVAMGLVGLVSIVKARHARRQDDPDADNRQAGRMEMERRMAAYLASREDGT
jgi:hypothetical protein